MTEIFPYPTFRTTQYLIASAVQRESNKTLLIDAETGSGKTAAILSALLSKQKNDERILIFTKTLGQMDAWFRELGLINDFRKKMNYSGFSMIPLLGRSRLCPLALVSDTKKQFAQVGCSLFDCTYPKSFYHPNNTRVGNESFFRQIITEIGEYIQEETGHTDIIWLLNTKSSNANFGCPYLVIKAALEFSPIVITTYPFLISSSLREFLIESMALDLTKTTIVVDEAHNLAKGNIAELSFKAVDRAIEEVNGHAILQKMVELRELEGLHAFIPSEDLFKSLEKKGKEYLKRRFKHGYKEISYTLKVCDFLRDADSCYLSAADGKYILYLKDPRTILSPVKDSKQLILISGTFRPMNHFANFIGVPNAKKFPIVSDTLRKNRIILTTSEPEVSMRFEERTKERFIRYGEIIKQLVEVVPGHTLVFAPKYEISEVLANLLGTNYFERPNQDITKLIRAVRASERNAVIVAPARGKISEGVEFVKDEKSLIFSVIVAGLPYPPPSRSLRAVIKQYSKFWGEVRATNYLCYLPAAVTIRQCLGRMIRSENDVGAWIILDNRISNVPIFPRAIDCKNTRIMVRRLKHFFEKHKLI